MPDTAAVHPRMSESLADLVDAFHVPAAELQHHIDRLSAGIAAAPEYLYPYTVGELEACVTAVVAEHRKRDHDVAGCGTCQALARAVRSLAASSILKELPHDEMHARMREGRDRHLASKREAERFTERFTRGMWVVLNHDDGRMVGGTISGEAHIAPTGEVVVYVSPVGTVPVAWIRQQATAEGQLR